MSREPKPYSKKQQQRWVCTIDGKRITLGADKKTALEKFHQLMLNRETVQVSVSTVYDLTQSYLDWCQANRKPTTYDLHKTYLQSLIESCGKQVRIGDFKVHHITKWIEGFESSSTTKHNMISIVQRMFNWAVEQQYLVVSPIQKIVKPRKKRRDVVYTPDQWAKIKAQYKSRISSHRLRHSSFFRDKCTHTSSRYGFSVSPDGPQIDQDAQHLRSSRTEHRVPAEAS